VLVDVALLPPTAEPLHWADYFALKVGNDEDPTTWDDAPEPVEVTVRLGEGTGGSDRLTLIWEDHAIQDQWLQVTVLANEHTGLAEPDVFYFSNAVGESGDAAADARVNAVDMLMARNNPRTLTDPAAIDFPCDYNRDGRVNATDMLLARGNQTHLLDALKLIAVPGENDEARMTNDEIRVAAWSAWLYEIEPVDSQRRPESKDPSAPMAVDPWAVDASR